MVVKLLTTIFQLLICIMKNYMHCTEMNTDTDEVERMTVDVVDEDQRSCAPQDQHQLSNGKRREKLVWCEIASGPDGPSNGPDGGAGDCRLRPG